MSMLTDPDQNRHKGSNLCHKVKKLRVTSHTPKQAGQALHQVGGGAEGSMGLVVTNVKQQAPQKENQHQYSGWDEQDTQHTAQLFPRFSLFWPRVPPVSQKYLLMSPCFSPGILLGMELSWPCTVHHNTCCAQTRPCRSSAGAWLCRARSMRWISEERGYRKQDGWYPRHAIRMLMTRATS